MRDLGVGIAPTVGQTDEFRSVGNCLCASNLIRAGTWRALELQICDGDFRAPIHFGRRENYRRKTVYQTKIDQRVLLCYIYGNAREKRRQAGQETFENLDSSDGSLYSSQRLHIAPILCFVSVF